MTPIEEFRVAEETLKIIEGRWKLRILVHLRANEVMRFSELERAIPSVTPKKLIQQLRELERDGAVKRTAYAEVPPRVEYRLTPWGQDLCPALDALRSWAARKPRDNV
ncbi:MAG TPA: helix-turn-helix domain-containing protein [Dongiaceae bacterium]|nr:helix-turn-helix domain-containing protein [Dongiaceae bacterium]